MTGHLIHIGFAKAGSNFLRRWFAHHPQLEYTHGGIAGFKDVYEISKHSALPRLTALYRVTSSEALATPHPHVGDSRIDYDRIRSAPMAGAQAKARDILAALFPNAHILLVTRGFRSMMISSYSQYVRSGGPDDFSSLQTGFTSADGETTSPWNYDYIIGLYRQAFGSRLIVLPYELLRDDATLFIRELEASLGLAHFDAPAGRLNASLAAENLSWYPRITRFLRALPIGHALRRHLFSLYVRGAMANRFGWLVRILQYLCPIAPVTADLIREETLDRMRGQAASLREDRLYAPYLQDYLL